MSRFSGFLSARMHRLLNPSQKDCPKDLKRRAWVGYALAPLSLCIAVLGSELLNPVWPTSYQYLFLAAVVLSGWWGGRGPGLLAAVLAPLTLDYFFLPPLYTLGFSPESRPYVVPFLLSGLAAAWMSSTRHIANRAREELKQNEEKYRRILSNMPDIAWTVDENRCIVYMSPRVVEVLGYTSEEIRAGKGDLLHRRIHPEDEEPIAQAWKELFASRKAFDVEYRIQAKNGNWVWIHNRAIQIYGHCGTLRTDGRFSDVTRRKQDELDIKSKTAFLEALVDSTVDGILVVNETGNRSLLNQRFINLFSVPAEITCCSTDQPLLRHVTGLVKEPDAFLDRILHLYNHPQETSQDQVELVNGTILDRYSAPVIDSSGKYYGRIWTFRDITSRIRSEETLRLLSAAVEQSPVIVEITDPKGNITYVNRKFTECTGYSLQEAIGKDTHLLNDSGYSLSENDAALWETLLQGKEWRGEFRSRKKNGDMYWEAATITAIFNPAGVISHFLAVKEDTTERRTLESDLRQAQKLEGIGQLAAGIAHEINTPTQFVTDNLTFFQQSWTAVSRLFDLYRKVRTDCLERLAPDVALELKEAERKLDWEFIGEEIPHAIAQSLDGARRVAHIVRAMKEFSHPDSADKTATDLNKTIDSTITVARNEWKYVAEMVTDFDETLPPVICYPGEVNQAILNLVVNAAHAIREKIREGERGRITVSTRNRGKFVEIAVADTGMGIPEAIQSRIYEPFFTTKEVGKGTGQGLALAHSVVVKKHQGKIWFETEVGRGTTFFVQLPVGESEMGHKLELDGLGSTPMNPEDAASEDFAQLPQDREFSLAQTSKPPVDSSSHLERISH
jgi:PAS domain S-box-containing protein